MAKKILPEVRGLLIHVSHYDPVWYERKRREKPFDPDVAVDVVRAAAEGGLNLMVIDCEDGVKYRSHPELARHYTVPMSALRKVAKAARAEGLDLVPKINFSQSRWRHHHNDWFRPHNDLFDSDEYWRLAFEVIDELIGELRPRRFFHVGMDEDHERSHRQYVAAIRRLRDGLGKRGLRPVVWNDCAYREMPSVENHSEKCMEAEKKIQKNVVEVVWCYERPAPGDVKRLVGRGFDVWGAPGGRPERVRAWRDAILKLGGKGLLLTNWISCNKHTRRTLLDWISACAPAACGE